MKTPLWCLLAVLALSFVAAGKKEPELTVRFYTEGNAQDSLSFSLPVIVGSPPHKAFISKIPNISERDVSAIYLFVGSDGTVGCSFILDEHGKMGLDTLSVEKRGTSLVAVVNGRHVIDMLIDKRISDGIITIPRGLNIEEGRMLRKTFKSIRPVPARQ
ncbi:MAG: hypothetical protein WCD79_07650 [Chthoniobacteraceae bacterium]